jgi:hypothetical protein
VSFDRRYQVIAKWAGHDEGVLDAFPSSKAAISFAEKEVAKAKKYTKSDKVPLQNILVYDSADDIVVREWVDPDVKE